MNETIAYAIREMQVLEFDYQGFHRIVEPHTLGLNHKGHEVFRGYQTGGSSRRGSIQEWKIFTVDEVKHSCTNGQRFSEREGYEHGDKAFSTIYVEV